MISYNALPLNYPISHITYRSRYIIIIIIFAIQVPSFQPSLWKTSHLDLRCGAFPTWTGRGRSATLQALRTSGLGANLRDTSERYLGYEPMGFCGWDLFMVIQAIFTVFVPESLWKGIEQAGTRFWAAMKGCCKEPASGIAPTVFPLIVADFKHSLLLSSGTGTVT